MGNKLARRRPQVDDRYTKPQGLYQHKDVDHKKLRRLIIESKLAPCYPGAEDAAIDLDECPICFLHYPSLNRSKCCTKGICTECFLQVKSPHSARPTQCPFCKTPSYAVEYKGAKTLEEKGVEQAEEQKVIEAKIRIRRQQEIQDEEARLRRQEDVSQERPPSPLREENEQNLVTAPAFPVFAGSTLADDRSLDRMSAAERSWNNWTSVDRPAIGYPQPDFFTFPPVTADSESMWFRGGQGDPGVTRPNLLSSSSAITARNSASFNLRRAAWNNSSTGDISGQGPPTGSGYLQYNRDDDFDLDLEDIMVMEAIWLSIQEQGSQRPIENNSESPFPSPFSEHQCDSQEERMATLDFSDSRGRRGSVTGGFASAIAALAERQVTGNAPLSETGQTDSESNDSAANSTPADGQGASDPQTIEEQIETESGLDSFLVKIQEGDGTEGAMIDRPNAQSSGATGSISSSESLTTWMREGSVETSSDVLLDQSSEVVEVGTSFCSSVPSASELPWEAPEVGDGTPEAASCNPPPAMVLESFEEQMMLAMALSLAEAQAKNGVNQTSNQTQHD